MAATFVRYLRGTNVVEFTFDYQGRECEGLISGEALDDHFGMPTHTARDAQVAFEMEPETIEAAAAKLMRRGRDPHISTSDL